MDAPTGKGDPDVPAPGFDVSAWTPLLRTEVERTLRRYGGRTGAQDVDDATQDILLWVLERVRSGHGPDVSRLPMRAWMVLNARARTIDGLRARRPGRMAPLPPDPSDPAAIGPDAAAQEGERARAFRRGFDRLPARDRALAEFVLVHGLSYARAAALTGIHPNSVGPTLHRIRGTLRDTLGEPR